MRFRTGIANEAGALFPFIPAALRSLALDAMFGIFLLTLGTVLLMPIGWIGPVLTFMAVCGTILLYLVAGAALGIFITSQWRKL